jgi:hypothetical protein
MSTRGVKSREFNDSRSGSKTQEVNLDQLEVVLVLLGGILVLLTISVVVFIWITGRCNWIQSVLAFIAIAGASFAFGSSIGFLFGIPRVEKLKASANESNGTGQISAPGYYKDNTNLEEISDWLTKIILGLTLVELKPILSRLHYAAVSGGRALGMCCETCTDNYYTFTYCIMILYFLTGGGLCYLWTRTNLQSVMESRRSKILKLKERELDDRKRDLETKVNKVVNERDESVKLTSIEVAADNSARQKFEDEIRAIYQKREIKHADDLQRGRWGGLPSVSGVTLGAISKKEDGGNGFFVIELNVKSTSETGLGSFVAFFLHDTFSDEIEIVEVKDEVATLRIQAFEAFVVGARTESGIELELDLNKVKGFPREFYY